MHFLAKYGRSYASKEDVNHRFNTFSANYDKIMEHNAQNDHFKMAINQFSDLSEEEFAQHYNSGLSVPLASSVKKHKVMSSEVVSDTSLPESVDWSSKVSVPGN